MKTKKRRFLLAIMCLAASAIFSCKKKKEIEPDELMVPQGEASQVTIFRPLKVYHGEDSSNLPLKFLYQYDTKGRIKTKTVVFESGIADSMRYEWTYLPALTLVKRFTFDHSKQKYFYAGYDSLFLVNNRIERSSSIFMYQLAAVEGNHANDIHIQKNYHYTNGDSSEVQVRRPFEYHAEEPANYVYRVRHGSELLGYRISPDNPTTPPIQIDIKKYNPVHAKFADHQFCPFSGNNEGLEFTGLPLEVWGKTSGDETMVTLLNWTFDTAGRPATLSIQVQSGTTPSAKTHYRFEY